MACNEKMVGTPCWEKAQARIRAKKEKEKVEKETLAVATPSMVDDTTIPRLIKIVRPTHFRGRMYQSGEFSPEREEGKAFVSAYKTSELLQKSVEIIQ